MALDYGLKGSIDIADSRTRALTLRADGEPVFNPAANRWADELKASDGAWRFLRGGSAAGRGVGNVYDSALADNFTVLCLVRAKKPNWGAVLRKMSDGATVGWAAQQAPQRSSGLYVRVDPTVNANLARCEYTKPKDLDWHWYSFSFSGLNIYSWLDAGARKSETRPTGDLTNTQNFVAGTGSSTSHIAATLIYSRVLTDAEVSNIMSGRTMPREVAGLIGYYKFNEGSGTTCTDHSGSGNHLVYTSPVWEVFDPASTAKSNFASGQPYTPAVLKSSNWWDRLPPSIADPEMMGCSWGAIGSIAYQPVMNITGDLTAAVWHKPLKVRSNGDLISIACSYVSANGPISIQFRGLTVSVNVGNTATQTSSTFVLSKPVPLGKWTHWCVTLSGTTLSLYINGILIGTATNAAAHGTTSAFVSLIDSSSGTRNAARSIRLFSRALSASEVNELFLTDRIGNRTGLVGEWLCNTPHSTTISDTSGNGLHTTTSNPRLLDSPYQVARRKRFGKQVRLNNSSYLVTTDSFDLQVSTIAAWVKWNGYKDGASKGTIVGSTAFGLQLRIESTGAATLLQADVVEIATTRAGIIQVNGWAFVSCDYDGTTANIYVNGKLAKSATNARTISSTTYGVGAKPIGAEFYRGVLDDVRIYNRALSAAEHYQLFLDQAPRNGLVAEYLFDSDTTNCQDTSGNGFHATWSGISAANYVQEV